MKLFKLSNDQGKAGMIRKLSPLCIFTILKHFKNVL